MVSFKEMRELLVISRDESLIEDEEFLSAEYYQPFSLEEQNEA